ncbi:MAG TPA: hypothetical protein VHF46_00885 [Rubrobacteraceae bacterium]|nr:hypothetical protein [Rubrobacteraceae bacterium]
MPLRVNPILLLSLILIFVLSIGIWASAQLGVNPIIGVGQEPGLTGAQPVQPAGGSGDPASLAEGQMGDPFMLGADGPDAFSCVGLMRFVLRETGIDPNAPWVPEEYLSRYTPVAPGDERRGDIAIFPGWATMLTGDGHVISANEMAGHVTKTPLSNAGAWLGVVRPGAPAADPLATPVTDPLATPVTDPLAAPVTDQLTPVTDPLATPVTDPLAAPVVDPLTGVLPLATGVLPLASQDPYAGADQYADPTLYQGAAQYAADPALYLY